MLAHTVVISFLGSSQKRQPGNEATTVGCPESTAVDLLMYQRQSNEIGQMMTITAYMY